MRIATSDGTAVTLQPRGWEYPPGPDDDDLWLVITGHVVIGDRNWSFTNPCLTLDEANELAGWLRAAADGSLQPAPAPQPPTHDRPQLGFIEPVLGFTLATRDQDAVVVRVSFAYEAAPPWADEDTRLGTGQLLDLRVPPAVLTAAATQWTSELAALPAPG